MFTLAQAALGGWSIGSIALAVIVIAGICAVAGIVLNRLGYKVPEWVQAIFWVVVVVVIGAVAIKFLMTLF